MTKDCEEHSSSVLDDPVLKGISERIGCTVAQLSIAWAIKRNVAVVTKTESRPRMNENLNSTVFIEKITSDDMKKIDSLNANICKFWDISKFP